MMIQVILKVSGEKYLFDKECWESWLIIQNKMKWNYLKFEIKINFR